MQASASSSSLPSRVPICLCPTASLGAGRVPGQSVPLLQTGQSPGGRWKPGDGAAFLRDPTALRAILPLRGPLPSVTSLPPSAHGITSLRGPDIQSPRAVAQAPLPSAHPHLALRFPRPRPSLDALHGLLPPGPSAWNVLGHQCALSHSRLCPSPRNFPSCPLQYLTRSSTRGGRSGGSKLLGSNQSWAGPADSCVPASASSTPAPLNLTHAHVHTPGARRHPTTRLITHTPPTSTYIPTPNTHVHAENRFSNTHAVSTHAHPT